MRKHLVAAVPFAAMISTFVLAAPQEPPAAWRRLEGAWVRTDPDGAGSFGGLGSNIPAAHLKPGVSMAGGGRGGRGGGPGGGRGGAPNANAAAAPAGPHKEGDPYIAVAQPCGGGAGRSGGALLINPDSGGVHFVVSKNEVIFGGERGRSAACQ